MSNLENAKKEIRLTSKWRKKPVVIEATQWFRNGDHPLDGPNATEGVIVRYFRRPDISGESLCSECGKPFHVHGWIDTLEGGHRVCPGDWIITGVKGELYPCKPHIFAITYEATDTSPPASAKDGMSERERKLLEAARKALPILRDAMAINVSGDPREFGGGFADRLAYDAVEEALAAYEGKDTP